MKRKAWLFLLLLLGLAALAGCGAEATPYENNDADGYTVSVKYDANGGTFTTNTSVIVDSYSLSDAGADSRGKARFALLSPDDTRRGNDAFTPVYNGYFLAGWYAQRTETLNEAGESIYVYAQPWDFENDLLEVDAQATYSAQEPVLTLYAAWIPLFCVEYYDLETGELLDSYLFDPDGEEELTVPAWDPESGLLEMYAFPQRKGYTFAGAYYDRQGTQPVETASVEHPGQVDPASGTGKDTTLKLYLAWEEGEWFHIYHAEQFTDHASLSGNYVIYADLDFTDEIWPTSLMYGNFTGTIRGNGHTFRNINVTQTNNSKVNAGLFGHLTESAVITDLTLENVTFTIKTGTRVTGASYGLLAGTIAADATLNGVKIASGTLQIDSGCYFGADDYSIGLLCGMGDAAKVAYDNIRCQATGDAPDTVSITVDGNAVTVNIVKE